MQDYLIIGIKCIGSAGKAMRRVGRLGPLGALLVVVWLLSSLLLAGPTGAAPSGPIAGLNGAICTYNTIGAAIAAASSGDTIYLAPGTYFEPLGTLDRDLSFVGATTDCTTEEPANSMWDYVIDGAAIFWPNGGVVNIAPGHTVSFTRIMLQNGFADYGGNVYVSEGATAIFEQVRVHDGFANFNGGNVYVAEGGSLFINYASWINDGIAGNNGGGLFLAGTAELDNANLHGNEALQGGGVAMTGDSYLYAYNVDIGTGIGVNKAQEGGGVHMTGNARFELDCNTRVNSNFALAGDGGGIHASGDVSIDMSCNSMVRGNDAAAGFGGGIYAENNARITMREDSLVGTENPAWANTAIRGAGLYLKNVPSFSMEDEASVLYNVAGDFGGGVYMSDGSFMSMRGGLIAYNVAGVAGGGIALIHGDTELSEGATIRGNQAMFGGGVAQWPNLANAFTATNAHIDGNHALVDGGGMHVLGGDVSLKDTDGSSTLSNNMAVEHGGGLFADGPVTLQMRAEEAASELRVANNSAGLSGGGFYAINGSESHVTGKLTVAGNEATNDGGGFFQDGGIIIFEGYPENHLDNRRPLITGNTAVTGNGGGFFLKGVSSAPGDPNSLLFNSVVDGNAADAYGGGLYISDGSIVHLLNTRVLNNDATEGAGMKVVDATVEIKRDSLGCDNPLRPADEYCSELRGNNATGKGGAIALENGANFNLEDSAIIGNSASLGSALLSASNGDRIDITNSLISLNSGKAVFLAGDAQMDVVHSTLAGNDWALDIDGAGASVDIQNTIAWDNGFGIESAVAIMGGCSISQNGVGGAANDPLFHSTMRGDYRLPASSPAVDACAIGTDFDLDETPRPQGVSHDMGAFEAGLPYFLFTMTLKVPEGDTGVSNSLFEITLSEPSNQIVEVTVDAVGLSATEGVDFNSLSQTITFDPGVTSRYVTVEVIGDLLIEGDEELELQFSNPIGGELVVSSASIIIEDDDEVVEPAFTSFLPIVVR